MITFQFYILSGLNNCHDSFKYNNSFISTIWDIKKLI